MQKYLPMKSSGKSMKVLVIGNIFESKSFLVDNFCDKDSEVIANGVSTRISGAAIVVSTIAAFLKMNPTLYSKAKMSDNTINMLNMLNNIDVDINAVDTSGVEDNTLLTIYNKQLERKCYSYTPNQLVEEDLIKIDYSKYDATFFCCIPFEQIQGVFERNTTICKTISIILASGLTKQYFENTLLQIKPQYIFMNRGELLKVFNLEWNESVKRVEDYLKLLEIGKSNLIVTKGKDGVMVKNGNMIQDISVDNINDIVHPGGAGDAFSVGFLNGVLLKKDIFESCRLGHKCAKMLLSVKSTEELIRNLQ